MTAATIFRLRCPTCGGETEATSGMLWAWADRCRVPRCDPTTRLDIYERVVNGVSQPLYTSDELLRQINEEPS